MLDDAIIEVLKSPWVSPVLIVKKDSTHLFAGDYPKLNSVTKNDAYPLPIISYVLDQLTDAKYLDLLDTKFASGKVSVFSTSCEYTAFTVTGGLYRFKRVLFDFTNAPATLQLQIGAGFGPALKEMVLVDSDDIVVVSSIFEKSYLTSSF